MREAVRLVVNADDLGMTPSINETIVECHRRGIVTSASLMANMAAAEDAVRRCADVPTLSVGLHLNLTQGRPVSPPQLVATLVGEDGEFLPKTLQLARLRLGTARVGEVRRELEAQIGRALELGCRPTHCDGHHGVTSLRAVRDLLADLLPRFGIRYTRVHVEWRSAAPGASRLERLRCAIRNAARLPSILEASWTRFLFARVGVRTAARRISRRTIYPRPRDPKRQLLACLAVLPPGVAELVLHPGSGAVGPGSSPRFEAVRRVDTELALDPDVAAAIRALGIGLVSYREL
jgi:predicted glycoside hydrolase/deacetylase ChbG (UPF0249 family)